MSSLHAENSDESLSFLQLLGAICSFIFLGVFLSRLRQPSVQQVYRPERGEGSAQEPLPTIEGVTPELEQGYANTGRDSTPRRKKFYEWSVGLGTCGLLAVNLFLWLTTRSQVNLLKRQLIGTQAALVQANAQIQPDHRTVQLHAINSRQIDATNVHATVVMAERDAVTGKLLGSPKVICKDYYEPVLSGAPCYKCEMTKDLYPKGLYDDIQLVVKAQRWIELTTDYSYGNGFGSTISDSSCLAYIVAPGSQIRNVLCDEAPLMLNEYKQQN